MSAIVSNNSPLNIRLIHYDFWSEKCVHQLLTSQVAGPYEYTYRHGKDIDSYPIYGELQVYGGGGYVAELRGDRAAIYDKIAELKAGGWIDKYTRAVFLEFAVYNPNVCHTQPAQLHVVLSDNNACIKSLAKWQNW